ncbi:MAG TPA: RNA polymerase sigma factor [Chryseosolibacter sp.]|nr:RNA polymerase sigma factor [Chryseosolibacter sp.]
MTFEEIYKQYSKKVFRVCLGFLNDYDRAKDVMQDTFIAVWQNLSKFREEANVGTWVFRIATNNCLKAIEKSKRTDHSNLVMDIPDIVHDNAEAKFELLHKCIAELEETERIIISLVLEDLSQADIASIVGTSDGNIRVKIFRIREKLAQKIKDYGGFN